MGDSWVRMALRESFTVCDCGLISASKARLSERCRMMRSPANQIKPWLDKCPLMLHKNWAYHTAAVVHVTQAVSRKVISPIRAEPYTTWLRLCARARLKTNEVSPQALLEPFIQKSNQHSPHERKNMACWVMSLDRTLTPIGLDDDITDEFNKALQKSGKDNIIDNLISRKKLKRMGLNCTLYQESFSDKDAYCKRLDTASGNPFQNWAKTTTSCRCNGHCIPTMQSTMRKLVDMHHCQETRHRSWRQGDSSLDATQPGFRAGKYKFKKKFALANDVHGGFERKELAVVTDLEDVHNRVQCKLPVGLPTSAIRG